MRSEKSILKLQNPCPIQGFQIEGFRRLGLFEHCLVALRGLTMRRNLCKKDRKED